MHTNPFALAILSTVFATSSASLVRLYFDKCDQKGFTCPVSPTFTPRLDIVFECYNTTQEVQFYLWQFNSPANIASFTIQKCDRVQISFTCTAENKPIQWLKIKDVGVLEIIPTTTVTHNPPEIYFENISYIETIPTNTFSQIKYAVNKAGCFVPLNDTKSVYFKDLNVGTISTDAFSNLQLIKKFSWSNVSVNRIQTRAVNISFEDQGCGDLRGCNLGVLEPLAFLVTGDSFSVTRGRIRDIWTSGLNGTIYEFQFSNNTIDRIQSGAISILSQNVYIINNNFKQLESGCFRKISPGLLHDSDMSFSNLRFSYYFNNNVLGQVDDGSFRPDTWSYKNVNADLCFTNNTLPCSCEGLTWLNDDIYFGSWYSVIKEFNNMLLDPENSNTCYFTPCTCFGGRLNERQLTSTATEAVKIIKDISVTE